MTFGQAVVIGKFYPPHRGHKFLIDTAMSLSQRVTVIVCGKPTDDIPGERRGEWLREIHPTADVMVIDDRYDANDTAVWAANTMRWLGGPPDVVFTSEDYGEPYARAMGCVHVMVDKDREAVPCSATMIRTNPLMGREFLEPVVWAWFVKRVCLVGAESTGKTTLSRELAAHFQTEWVPEYGRDYSAVKFERGETEWTTEEFVHIAAEQTRMAERAARTANGVLIEDTNAFATWLWHRRYMGHDSDAVRAEAAKARCDLYLLTGDEIPFEQDGLRDGEHIRHDMHGWFAEELRRQGVPWVRVDGTREERLAKAIAAIDALMNRVISR